jgi:hypothetical protein
MTHLRMGTSRDDSLFSMDDPSLVERKKELCRQGFAKPYKCCDEPLRIE